MLKYMFNGKRGMPSRPRGNEEDAAPRGTPAIGHLPPWPFTILFLAYPLWWILGLSDLIWLLGAGVMVLYLIRFRAVQVPRGFGVWLLFLVWMTCSGIQIDTPDRMIGFIYRCLIYYSVTVIFMYVYNSVQLTAQKIMAALCSFWIFVVVGGFLGIWFPTVVIKTPLSYVLPYTLLQNDLVNQMAIRRLTQFNPDAWLHIDPRPSAPFLYTNNWGAAFSLLLPFIAIYLWQIRGQRKFWWIAGFVPVAFVPAVLTLNRGMFLGLALAIVYVGIRFALAGNKKGIGAVLGFAAVAVVMFTLLPVSERLSNRLDSSPTTQDREGLYIQAIKETLLSPFFGHGAPRPSNIAGVPSVGTQGQLWMVLYSHGFIGAGLFILTFIILFVSTLRRVTPLVLGCNAILLVSILEIFYYGMLTTGLVLMMVAGAVALRERNAAPPGPALDKVATAAGPSGRME